MSRLLNILSWAWDVGAAGQVIEEAADAGYNTAIDMCGNEGQVSIIDLTGYDAYVQAAQECFNGGYGLYTLEFACPYPDAVGEILAESYGVIEEYINEFLDEVGGDDGDFEEGDEEFED